MSSGCTVGEACPAGLPCSWGEAEEDRFRFHGTSSRDGEAAVEELSASSAVGMAKEALGRSRCYRADGQEDMEGI